MEPLVSTRVSLRWPPAAAYEDTDTLVIQGRTGLFLDLRVFTSGDKKGTIDWASAGYKRWLPGSSPENPKAAFDAVIDSRRTPDAPTGDADEGSFTTLPNGDVLETGRMSNPDASGAMQPYEEVWRRLKTSSNVAVLALQSVDKRTFLGRVGQWQIALQDKSADAKEPFLARRWDMDELGSWEEIYCIGGPLAKERLPLLPDKIDGDRIEIGQQTFDVLEQS